MANKFLRRNVNTVFIMLGNSCNMNCAYCLQHPLVNKPISSKINPDIYEFIAQVTDEMTNNRVQIQFYGGEPLLYFSAIKKFIAHTQHLPLNYSIISNGKAITQEIVDFLNDKQIPITISWDGYNTAETRRFDVFAHKEIKDLLFQIKQLGLSAVISAKSYPKELLQAFQELSDEYAKIHGYQLRMNFDEIFDTGLDNKELLQVDYDKVEKQMYELIDEYIESLEKKDKQISYMHQLYCSSLFETVKDFYINNNGIMPNITGSCGNGITTLNLDLEGNLYYCHNTSENCGNIYNEYWHYLKRVLKHDKIRFYRKTCQDCPAVALCRGGCKLVSKQAREETYCKLKRALYTPFINSLITYGKKILGGDG